MKAITHYHMNRYVSPFFGVSISVINHSQVARWHVEFAGLKSFMVAVFSPKATYSKKVSLPVSRVVADINLCCSVVC